jgi:hypothetical protein
MKHGDLGPMSVSWGDVQLGDEPAESLLVIPGSKDATGAWLRTEEGDVRLGPFLREEGSSGSEKPIS